MPSPYAGKVFSFDQDWSSPVIERIGWLTDVIRKRDGSEQRIRLRQKPRRTLEYNGLIGGQDELEQRRRFDAQVWASQNGQIMVPIWSDATELTAQVNSGSSSFILPQATCTGYDYASGAYVMFWRDYKTYEVVKITQLNQGTGNVSLETNTVSTWPAGTRVMPARLGLFDPIVSANLWATDIKSTVVKFELLTPTTAPTYFYRNIAPSLDSYRSTDVFNAPGLDGNNTLSVDRTMQRIDFGVGQFANDSIQLAPFHGVDCNLEPNGRTEIANLLGWFDSRVGRQKAFWLPTWDRDFDPVVSIAAAQFTASSFGYTANYTHKESRRDIALINADGSMSYRRITASSDDGTTETFTTDTNLPSLTNLERTSFLRYLRLDHDDIELTWETTEDLSVALKFRELTKTA
jgi:hypothetical protein